MGGGPRTPTNTRPAPRTLHNNYDTKYKQNTGKGQPVKSCQVTVVVARKFFGFVHNNNIMSDNEFTIRVTGAPPPPLPPKPESGGRRGKSGKSTAAKSQKSSQQQQQQRRYNLILRPSTSLDKLQKDVFALFNASKSSYILTFLSGFPPKELNSEGKSTVQELGIRSNESLIVKFRIHESNQSVECGESSEAKRNSKKEESSANLSATESTSASGRQKRASAVAATASFRDVIAAQDAIMQQDQKPSKKKATSSFASVNIGNPPGGKKRNNATTKGGAKKVKIDGTGYRLSDGKSFGSPPKKSNSKQQQQALFKSEDDIANSLLSSLGGSSGNVGKFLRAAMKGAVTKSYEASRAAVRVAAVNQGEYGFDKMKGGTTDKKGGVVLGTLKDLDPSTKTGDADADGDSDVLGRTLFTVSYSKGMEGRGRYTEEVEIIGLDALKGVIQSVYDSKSDDEPSGNDSEKNTDGREMLRPVSISQLSPRLFWSLVYHYSIVEKKRKSEKSQSEQKHPQTTKPSIEDMLREFMPHLDWCHLDRGGRKRDLSEKAKENLRQEKESVLHETSNGPPEEDGIKAIEEMENSIIDTIMSSKNDEDDDAGGTGERERRARAAMARFGNLGESSLESNTESILLPKSNRDSWELVTPIDDDIDELIECIMEGLSSDEETIPHESYDKKTARVWASALLESGPDSTTSQPLSVLTPSIRNWRELANAKADFVRSKLVTNSVSSRGKLPQPSLETIDKWIDAAQQRSMEEIMLEILDGDQDALDLLLNKARSGSPKDLSYWYSAPKLLLDAISISTDNDDHKGGSKWVEGDVIRWSSRAKIALRTCPWLDLYTTPVAQ